MKSTLIFAGVALLFLAVLVLVVAAFNKDFDRPADIDRELTALIYSSSSLESKDYYIIFAAETEPIKASADSVVPKFDSQIKKPSVKIWLKQKEVAKKAEIWFRDRDQMREYLR